MTDIKRVMPRPSTWEDAAVDGLINGVLAGAVMATFLAVAGLLGGESPISLFARFDPSSRLQPLAGALTHLAVAGVYGVLFGIAFRLIARRVRLVGAALLIGAAYGMLLLVIAETVILPGSHSPLLELPTWELAASHLVYGLTLGWLVNRTTENSR